MISLGDHLPSGALEAIFSSSPWHTVLSTPTFSLINFANLMLSVEAILSLLVRLQNLLLSHLSQSISKLFLQAK
jgi:hypothetical protein